jgi:hypothetical protein
MPAQAYSFGRRRWLHAFTVITLLDVNSLTEGRQSLRRYS